MGKKIKVDLDTAVSTKRDLVGRIKVINKNTYFSPNTKGVHAETEMKRIYNDFENCANEIDTALKRDADRIEGLAIDFVSADKEMANTSEVGSSLGVGDTNATTDISGGIGLGVNPGKPISGTTYTTNGEVANGVRPGKPIDNTLHSVGGVTTVGVRPGKPISSRPQSINTAHTIGKYPGGKQTRPVRPITNGNRVDKMYRPGQPNMLASNTYNVQRAVSNKSKQDKMLHTAAFGTATMGAYAIGAAASNSLKSDKMKRPSTGKPIEVNKGQIATIARKSKKTKQGTSFHTLAYNKYTNNRQQIRQDKMLRPSKLKIEKLQQFDNKG